MIEELRRPEVRRFIIEHEHDDPAALVLSANKYPDLPIQLIARQIQSRQKARLKIPSFYDCRDVVYPLGISMEQCSSERTAQYKSHLLSGKTLTDLTGGFGIDTYYFAKTFEQVNYVECQEELAKIVEYNFQVMSQKNVLIHQMNSFDFLSSQPGHSDSYFIDPARRDSHNRKVFNIHDCKPDISEIIPELLHRKSQVLVKLSPMLDIHQALKRLSNITEVHVVAVDNECKEVLLKLTPGFEGEPDIFAINLLRGNEQIVKFRFSEEETFPEFSLPKQYLYEPNAALLKAGAYNTIAKRFKLGKLHRNTQLYTSDDLVEGFPGRSFQVVGVSSISKKKLRSEIPEGKASITVRNYPDAVSVIRKKTGLKEGGEKYIFATTLMDNKHAAIICKKPD